MVRMDHCGGAGCGASVGTGLLCRGLRGNARLCTVSNIMRSQAPRAFRHPVLLLLLGVALLQDAAAADATEALSFKVDVVSKNRKMARHLERHLDIQRFTDFPDLQPGELRRLLGETESNARDLLAAQGYFNPQLNLKAGDADSAPGKKRHIVIEVDPGELTRVESHEIRLAGEMEDPSLAQRLQRFIERDWLLPEDETFTQEAWDTSKNAGLRVLQRRRYPTARIVDSRADIIADTNLARLEITYDTGPAYFFGPLRLEGVERYDAQGIRNIAHLPSGEIYREETLLDTQQRLVTSGYFDSVFLTLDSGERNPQNATVIAQLREAKMQKIVFGPGYSTDTGPRVSIDHTHNKMWPLGWRAVNHLGVGTQTLAVSTNWTAMPAASGWAWNTGLALERSDVGEIKANTLSLNGGRSFLGDKTERRYYLQYDASNQVGGDSPASSSSLLGNYAWTGRYFNNRLSPTSGFGVGLDAGVGLTVTPERKPFMRINARGLYLWPFGERNRVGKRSRLALRAEAGTIVATAEVDIPARLLFLTGGDTTVRGYKYQSIGTRLDDGKIYGARNMAMASVEWQNPITLFGDSRSYEHLLFVDAGAAADQARDAVIYPGVGTGMRWASPMGPLELDVAYGTRTRNWKLHLRVGFQFQ
jgi:translocation and assembly module TamA